MYIYDQVSESDFIAAFQRLRPNNFSYAALRALYDWLGELASDTGEPIELDVIALCCAFAESTPAEIIHYYSVELGDEGTLMDNAVEFLHERTTVVAVSADTIVYRQF